MGCCVICIKHKMWFGPYPPPSSLPVSATKKRKQNTFLQDLGWDVPQEPILIIIKEGDVQISLKCKGHLHHYLHLRVISKCFPHHEMNHPISTISNNVKSKIYVQERINMIPLCYWRGTLFLLKES